MIAAPLESVDSSRRRSIAELLDSAVARIVRGGFPAIAIVLAFVVVPSALTLFLRVTQEKTDLYRTLAVFGTLTDRFAALALLAIVAIPRTREPSLGSALGTAVRYLPRFFWMYFQLIFAYLAVFAACLLPVAVWYFAVRPMEGLLAKSLLTLGLLLPTVLAGITALVWLSFAFYVALAAIVSTGARNRDARRFARRTLFAKGERVRSLVIACCSLAPNLVAYGSFGVLEAAHVPIQVSSGIFGIFYGIATAFTVSLAAAYREDVRARFPAA